MHEASYYTREDTGTAACSLCPHHCRIAPGQRGICRVRENRDGKLVSLVYGQPAAAHVDPIEKKPLFHFLPGSSAFSVSTVGCNLSCPFCQNHTLSVVERGVPFISTREVPAEEVVRQAEASGCRSLCFTYSEPTVFFEYMLEMARLAKERGLRTNMVSNGYIEKEPLEELAPFMDAANVDLKAFSEKTYREVLGGRLEPVLETIRRMKELGIWLEVTTLVVPEMNDSEQELAAIAGFLAEVGTGIPWHVSRFHPCHQWTHLPPTPLKTLKLALECGKKAGLKYIYTGNVPGEPSESTCCPGCGRIVIERWGFSVRSVHLGPGASCNFCGAAVDGVFDS
ncbi:MAG: AmmeMemoRadiSam system radical SAM enzyme [Candidatus Glassbacteria bacterium]|nr:AmmeMemoRadiSam system radical SAM enzyme [Candidatus Glassbacteria bacterium]